MQYWQLETIRLSQTLANFTIVALLNFVENIVVLSPYSFSVKSNHKLSNFVQNMTNYFVISENNPLYDTTKMHLLTFAIFKSASVCCLMASLCRTNLFLSFSLSSALPNTLFMLK